MFEIIARLYDALVSLAHNVNILDNGLEALAEHTQDLDESLTRTDRRVKALAKISGKRSRKLAQMEADIDFLRDRVERLDNQMIRHHHEDIRDNAIPTFEETCPKCPKCESSLEYFSFDVDHEGAEPVNLLYCSNEDCSHAEKL